MTDEIKMCREEDALWGPGKAWVPLDPQPCCENCDNATERDGFKVCFVVVDYLESPMEKPLAYFIRYPRFCCNFWKVKE